MPRRMMFVVLMLVLVVGLVMYVHGEKVIRVAYNSPAGTLDPHTLTATDVVSVRFNVFEPLLWLTEEGELEPRLATSWELSNDRLTYTFHLRKDVVFHDNSEFDATDVAATFNRYLESEWDSSCKAYVMDLGLGGVEIIDKYTIAIRTRFPSVSFIYSIAVETGQITTSEAIEKFGEEYGGLDNELVGTGPFKLKDWVKGDRIVLERFDGYWGVQPKIDKILYRVIPEAATRSAMLETGELDVVFKIWPDEAARLSKLPGIGVKLYPTDRWVFISMNMTNPPLDDVKVRQALNYAINTEEITQELLLGSSRTPDCVVAPEIVGYSPNTWPYEYNPAKAKQLLTSAGFSEANQLKLTMQCANNHYVMENVVAQAVQDYLSAVGVKVDLTISGDWPAHLSSWGSNPSDLLLMSWASSFRNVWDMLAQAFHPANAGKFCNQSRYDNVEFGQILDASEGQTDPEKSQEMYEEVFSLLAEDVPMISLYFQGTYVGLRGVKGVAMSSGEHLILSDAELIE